MKNNKSINTNSIKKLDDDSLENIIGGTSSGDGFKIAAYIGILVEFFLATGAISLSGNSLWLRRKVKKAKEKTAKVKRMEKFADLYADVSIGMSGLAGTIAIAGGIAGGIAEICGLLE